MFICQKCCRKNKLKVEDIRHKLPAAYCEVCRCDVLDFCYDIHWEMIPEMVRKYQKKTRGGKKK